MTENRYVQLIHLLAIGVAIMMWVMSVQFSMDGFSFIVPKYQWMGVVLALSITVVELVFIEEGMQHTLTVVAVGLLSYLYGIITNIIGIWLAQGSPTVGPTTMPFPAVLGFFLEVSPLPLFLWGLLGTGARDILGHLLGNFGKTYSKGGQAGYSAPSARGGDDNRKY